MPITHLKIEPEMSLAPCPSPIMSRELIDLSVEKIDGQRLLALKDHQRVVPKAFSVSALFSIKGKGRRLLKQATIASNPSFQIAYSGEELNQTDLDVLLECWYLAGQCKCDCIHASQRGFLDGLGRTKSGAAIKKVTESLERMAFTRVDIKTQNAQFSGAIISGFVIDNAGITVKINGDLLRLFDIDAVWINNSTRKKLSGAFARWLQIYIATHKDNEFGTRISISKLREYSGSEATERSFSDQLQKAIKELKSKKVVQHYSIKNGVLWWRRGLSKAA